LKVTFLGTGTSQGVPVIGCQCAVCQSIDFRDKRLRSSVFVETETTHFVIDTGPDFRQQMLRERINRLDAVVFTHEHKDHTAGMDDIRSFNFLQKRDMPVYAREKVIQQLKQEFSYVFNDLKYPGVPRVAVHVIENQPFTINNTTVVPIEVLHYKLPVFGFRVEDFTYITDANFIPPAEKEKILGSKILVLNALQIDSHVSHFTLSEAINLVEEIQPEQAYFTHISHKMGQHAEISQKLPDNVFLAYDGLKLSI
jgi:phosphoribosyl 1,2-cyclic phosphate phosphodiesterase